MEQTALLLRIPISSLELQPKTLSHAAEIITGDKEAM